MEPWQLAAGERYTDGRTVRLIEDIDLKNDNLKYIENPRGGHVLGLCSIEDFCDWSISVYASEKEIWELR